MAVLRFSMFTIGQPQIYAIRPTAFAYDGYIRTPGAGSVTSAAVLGSATCPACALLAAPAAVVAVAGCEPSKAKAANDRLHKLAQRLKPVPLLNLFHAGKVCLTAHHLGSGERADQVALASYHASDTRGAVPFQDGEAIR